MTQAKFPTLSYHLCYNLPWVVTPKIESNTKQTVVKTEHFTAVFLYPFLERTWLNGKQKPHQSGTILSQRWWAVHSHYKFKASGMKSMSAFLRKACTWAGRDNYNYHKGMNGIIQKLKCLFMKRLGQIIRKWLNQNIRKFRSYIHKLVSFLGNSYQTF